MNNNVCLEVPLNSD